MVDHRAADQDRGAAAPIAGGEFAERIDVANRDELGALAVDVNRTSAELGSLYQQTEERAQELREALEQQTASSEVLNVISRSTSELQPVLDTIVATAARLCQADWAVIFKLESDGKYHLAAANQANDEFVRYVAENPIAPGRGTMAGRTALEGSDRARSRPARRTPSSLGSRRKPRETREPCSACRCCAATR